MQQLLRNDDACVAASADVSILPVAAPMVKGTDAAEHQEEAALVRRGV